MHSSVSGTTTSNPLAFIHFANIVKSGAFARMTPTFMLRVSAVREFSQLREGILPAQCISEAPSYLFWLPRSSQVSTLMMSSEVLLDDLTLEEPTEGSPIPRGCDAGLWIMNYPSRYISARHNSTGTSWYPCSFAIEDGTPGGCTGIFLPRKWYPVSIPP